MQGKSINDLYKTFVTRLQVVHSIREASQLAEWSLMHLMDCNSRADFILKKPSLANDTLIQKSMGWLETLLQGVPIQHLVGQVEFMGLELMVNEDVLIPRPETEELAHMIIHELPKSYSGRILDIGTGSGCIALALKQHLKEAQVSAIDVSESALKVARNNAQANGLKVDFGLFDILNQDSWDLGTFDLIVSNPPYIPINESSKMSPTVVDHEPSLALFTPNDEPLIFYKVIQEFASAHLVPDGKLYFELHEDYALQTLDMVNEQWPKNETSLIEDLQGKKRFLKTQL